MSEPRYKPWSQDQLILFQLDPAAQLAPGSFEAVLNQIVDERINLDLFHARRRNADTGCTAYDPAVLLKVVLLGYHRGLLSSREIERACRENATFVALSGDSRPGKSTIAAFISSMDDAARQVFTDVLQYCDHLGLIGGGHLAIDGCKLPSNASKQRSGYRKDFLKRRDKLRARIDKLTRLHQQSDHAADTADTGGAGANPRAASPHDDPDLNALETKLKRQQQQLDQLDAWLKDNPTDRRGTGQRKSPVQSNLTDPDSAKMKTSHGVIQGYTGIAAVDDAHQVILHAQAWGQGSENHLLLPSIEGTQSQLKAIGNPGHRLTDTAITADSGFSSTDTLQQLKARDLDAFVADKDMYERQLGEGARDHYKTRHRQERAAQARRDRKTTGTRFTASDFRYHADNQQLTCPAGLKLAFQHAHIGKTGLKYRRYEADIRHCRACKLRARCLRSSTQKTGRQVQIRVGRTERPDGNLLAWMQQRVDSERGRATYARRLGCVEPVFGNHRNHSRDRFTLRGQRKVNAQWLLYSAVHNIGKCQTRGLAA